MEDTNNNDRGIFINLTVPPNAEGGIDSLTFEHDGNELEILVPVGSVAGDVIQVQVGVGDNNNTSEDDNNKEKIVEDSKDTKPSSRSSLVDEMGGLKEDGDISTSDKPDNDTKMSRHAETLNGITTVELSNAQSLQLLEALPGENDDKHIDKGDGTCSMVWPSGILLAEALTSTCGIYFLKKRFQSDNFRCLELGSGLGVCGLALATAMNSCCKELDESESEFKKCNQVTVVLSDIGENTIKLLDMNIDRNRLMIANNMAVISEELVWGTSVPTSNEKFQIILGSDILYNTQESYDPLISTMKQHLFPEHGIIILSVRWRKPDLERKFFERAETEGIYFELWDDFMNNNNFAKRSPCQLDWREYGNPECEASNRFLSETTVSIGESKTAALANIKETDMERMSDEEHTIFEEMQCQIYIGKNKGASKKRERDEHTTT